MALTQGSYISHDDFNNLKNRIINEVKRRSTTSVDASLGNDYNHNTFTSIPNIPIKSFADFIQSDYFNLLLNFFNNFKDFPLDNLNDIYSDALVNQYDIIYALDLLLNLMTSLENENRQNNDDCKNECMGLCTNSCADSCSDKCTSCSGTCSGTCSSTCSGTCSGGCSGDCSGGCRTCAESCGGCGSTCGGNCTTMCGTGCSSIGMHPDG